MTHSPAVTMETALGDLVDAHRDASNGGPLPLRALQLHPPSFHNGIASTLEAVVERYDTRQRLDLTAYQKADLVQYLKSL